MANDKYVIKESSPFELAVLDDKTLEKGKSPVELTEAEAARFLAAGVEVESSREKSARRAEEEAAQKKAEEVAKLIGMEDQEIDALAGDDLENLVRGVDLEGRSTMDVDQQRQALKNLRNQG